MQQSETNNSMSFFFFEKSSKNIDIIVGFAVSKVRCRFHRSKSLQPEKPEVFYQNFLYIGKDHVSKPLKKIIFIIIIIEYLQLL